jgi:hypothetical protein
LTCKLHNFIITGCFLRIGLNSEDDVSNKPLLLHAHFTSQTMHDIVFVPHVSALSASLARQDADVAAAVDYKVLRLDEAAVSGWPSASRINLLDQFDVTSKK